jgi:GNAT superfamily N-acetyltransferase
MMLIREFVPEDAEGVSRLILRNLREVNTRDYSLEAVEAMGPFYTPERIIERSMSNWTIVCVHEDRLVGKASLDGDRVRNVFVDVDMHGQGIGSRLMAEIESHAQANGLETLRLHASPSAEGFYRKLGYIPVERIERELDGIPAPVVRMEKGLSIR